ncbi:MAG: hypothetical protein QHJ73_16140, partial [Armatimonadota bacterium]|nr:hypothetical protein [Armatimonadota bacterium]
LAVFDRVVATRPEFKKAWYLHSLQEPRVEGRTTTIRCEGPAYGGGEYGGQLVVETLLPTAPRIEKVGGPGKECWNEVTSRNYPSGKKGREGRVELGGWRIEVIPSRPAREDRFLHVLTVMDVGTPAPPVAAIETAEFAGARVLDRVVLFGQGDASFSSAELEVPGQGDAEVLAIGVPPGRWEVTTPGGRTLTLSADAHGKCVWFRTPAGRVRLRRAAG